MGQIVDPYSKSSSKRIHQFTVILFFSGYFDRYKNMKLLQIQSSGDEFFLPDNEVFTARESFIL